MGIRCSVCIAVYNGELFIGRQLLSILCQLSSLDEVIISDDGSIDRTLTVIKELNDGRIKVLKNPNKGIVSNYENALKHASGAYVFLSDQDDIWMPGKVEKHLELHKEYDLVVSDAVVVNNNEEVIYNSFFKLRNSGRGFVKNIIRNGYIGCCMSFKRELLQYAIPFPVKIHMHDWWIGLVAELFGKVIFLDQPYLKYVRHDKNASPSPGESEYSFVKRLNNRFFLLKNVLLLRAGYHIKRTFTSGRHQAS